MAQDMFSTTELVNKIFDFCYLLSGKEMFSYQAHFSKRIIRAVIENDSETLTALMSRQSGKSFTVSNTVSGLIIFLPILANMPMFSDDKRFRLFKDGVMVGIFAPTKAQSQIIFENIKDCVSCSSALEVLTNPDFNVRFGTFNGEKITLEFNNLNIKSTVTCKSASEGSNIEGGSYHILICDEAQDISNFKFKKSIFPTVSFYNGTKILIGTPNISKNFFYDTIQLNKKRWENEEIRLKSHFEFDCDVVVKANPHYAKTLESAKMILGENSEEYQMSYKLKWMFQYGMFIDANKFIEEPIAMKDKDREYICYDTQCIVGIDIGKSQDSTVVTVGLPDYTNPIIVEQATEAGVPDYVLYDVRILDWLEIVGDNYEEQYYKIMDFLKNFTVKGIVVDGTGVGAPVVDRLAANLKCPVVPFVFTVPSKSALMKYFDAYLKANCFHYPASPKTAETVEFKKFQEQFLELQKEYQNNHLVVRHPKERNKHDDYPFSAALMVWGLKTEMGAPELVTENKFFKTNSSSYHFTNRLNQRLRRRW
jgi:hypothetical protein